MLYFLTAISLIITYSIVFYFLIVLGFLNSASQSLLNLSFITISGLIFYWIYQKGVSKDLKLFEGRPTPSPKETFILSLTALALLAIFVFLFTHPFEEFLGGRDPNGHIRTATHIAKYKSIKMNLPILTEAYKEGTADLLFRTEQWRKEWIGHKGGYFVGSKMTNLEKGEITPQFFHLAPTITSFWIGFLGLKNVIYFMPTLYLIITFLFFAFVKTYISKNKTVSLLSLVVWLSSPAILFWSRSFNSESFVLLFVLVFMLNAYVYHKSKKIVFSLFAFIALLAAFLTRGDPLVFLPLAFTLIALSERGKAVLLTIFLSGLFFLGFYTALEDAYPYLSYNFGQILKIVGIDQKIIYRTREYIPIFTAATIWFSGSLLLWLKNRSHFMSLVKSLTRRVTTVYSKTTAYLASITSLVFIALYQFSSRYDFFSNRTNLIKISWYVGGILGWLLIIWGLAYLVRYCLNHIKTDKKFVLLLALILIEVGLSLFFLYNARISRDHPWWSRKFITSMIFLLPVSFAFIFDQLKMKAGRKLVITALAAISLITINFYYARPIIATQQYKGSYTFLNEFDACFGKDKEPAIFFDTSYGKLNLKKRGEYIAGYFFGPPLWIFYDRVIYYPKEGTDALKAVQQKAISLLAEGKTVFFVNPTEELLNLPTGSQKVCDLTFESEMVGWKSVVEPTKLMTDIKLEPGSITPINIPIKIFKLAP